MSLNAALSLFVEEYPKQTSLNFAGNGVAEFVRKEMPLEVMAVLDNDDRYIIKGSVGQGQWAKSPWLAIFDRFVTKTAQNGFYIVYLVCEDFSGIYLSLNQGITSVKKYYGNKDAKHALQVRASNFLAQLGNLDSSYTLGRIDLKTSSPSSLAAYYENGTICSKYYSAESIPKDEVLDADLKAMLDLYLILSSNSIYAQETEAMEEDEISLLEENLTALKEHKRIERNQSLSLEVKKCLGFVCQACGFDFEAVYGEIGHNFIEAHHLTPLCGLKGQKIKLNPKKDFGVLCSNCHSMIHKTNCVGDIINFKKFIKERN